MTVNDLLSYWVHHGRIAIRPGIARFEAAVHFGDGRRRDPARGRRKLYFVGLIAPRGPQIPIYGVQAKLVAHMIALHTQAGPHGLALATYFARVQEPELRIDIVRAVWDDQMADTERLLSALVAEHAAGREARAVA